MNLAPGLRTAWAQGNPPEILATPAPVETPTVGATPQLPSPVASASPVPLSLRANEAWIGIRTDGVPGSGRQTDPYDGSSAQKFDALMRKISEDTTIHLSAGTFQTEGGMAWKPKAHWTIIGAGVDKTVLLQTAIRVGQFQVIGSLASDVEVAHLTVDCNYLSLGKKISASDKAIGAVAAASGHIRNVKAIHSGGIVETFTLGFFQYGSNSIPASSVLIEDCRVEQSGPNTTAIFASNSQTNNNSDKTPGAGRAIIRNCYAEGTGDLATAGIAFQINGFNSASIDSCSTVGCKYSIYRDTLPQSHLTITNCSITGLTHAIGLVGARTNDVLIQGNFLAAGRTIVRTDAATNVTIKGNSFSPGPRYNSWWAPIRSSTSTYIINNRFDPAVVNKSGGRILGSFYGNRYSTGAVVPFLKDNLSPQSISQPFGRVSDGLASQSPPAMR